MSPGEATVAVGGHPNSLVMARKRGAVQVAMSGSLCRCAHEYRVDGGSWFRGWVLMVVMWSSHSSPGETVDSSSNEPRTVTLFSCGYGDSVPVSVAMNSSSSFSPVAFDSRERRTIEWITDSVTASVPVE